MHSPNFDAAAGLCATCAHVRVVTGARSVFARCDLSDRDARFPRYPTLPVCACDGYEHLTPASDGSGRGPSSASDRPAPSISPMAHVRLQPTLVVAAHHKRIAPTKQADAALRVAGAVDDVTAAEDLVDASPAKSPTSARGRGTGCVHDHDSTDALSGIAPGAEVRAPAHRCDGGMRPSRGDGTHSAC